MRISTFDQLKTYGRTIFTIGLLTFAQAVPLTMISTPAQAVDDDVDVICWDDDNGETQCETVESLKAECPLTDPEGTSDVCAQVLESSTVRSPIDLIFNFLNRIGR